MNKDRFSLLYLKAVRNDMTIDEALEFANEAKQTREMALKMDAIIHELVKKLEKLV